MNDLMKKLKKASTLEYADIMSDSDVYNTKEFVKLPVPSLNIAYSGSPIGGLSSGVHLFGGPSKHFKTMYALISAAAYLKQYPDAIMVFYDSEFGSPQEYMESVGINPKRVLHSPFTSLEELRTDLVNILDEVKRGDKMIIIIDSLGMSASKKEINDAQSGSDKADFTRAKVNKSIFRLATVQCKLKDIPLIGIQHTYQEMSLFPKAVIAGGTGQYYAADSIFIIGRQQEKDKQSDKEISGYNFVINVEKSRFCREKSKINISVRKVGGIVKYSGLLDLAMEGEFITNEGRKYMVNHTGEVFSSKKEIENNGEVFEDLLGNEKFVKFIESKYRVSTGKIIADDEDEENSPELLLEEEFNGLE